MGKIPDRWMRRGSSHAPRPLRKTSVSPSHPAATAKEIQILRERWLPYSSIGRRVPGTRFIAFKVPLKPALNNFLSPIERFTISDLLKEIPNLGLVIDLTQTDRYYNKSDVVDRGVDYIKIACKGQTVPSNADVEAFFAVVDYYLDRHSADDTLIGVHCTHGVNRTGYLLCRYMIQRMGIPMDDAIESVSHARGHPIERPKYLYSLKDHLTSYPKSFLIPTGLMIGKKNHPLLNPGPELTREPMPDRHSLRDPRATTRMDRGDRMLDERSAPRNFSSGRPSSPGNMQNRIMPSSSSRVDEQRRRGSAEFYDSQQGDKYGFDNYTKYDRFNPNRDLPGSFGTDLHPKSPTRGPPPRRSRPEEERHPSRTSRDYDSRPLTPPPRPYPSVVRDKSFIPPLIDDRDQDPSRKFRPYTRDDSFRRDEPPFPKRLNDMPEPDQRSKFRRQSPPVTKPIHPWEDTSHHAGNRFSPRRSQHFIPEVQTPFSEQSPPPPSKHRSDFDRERRDPFVDSSRKDWGMHRKYDSSRGTVPPVDDEYYRNERRGRPDEGPPIERDFPHHSSIKRDRRPSPDRFNRHEPAPDEFPRRKSTFGGKPFQDGPPSYLEGKPKVQPRFQRDDGEFRRDNKPFIPKGKHSPEHFPYERHEPHFEPLPNKSGNYGGGGFHQRQYQGRPDFQSSSKRDDRLPPEDRGFVKNYDGPPEKQFGYKRMHERPNTGRYEGGPPKRFRSRSPVTREPPIRRMRSLSPPRRELNFGRRGSPGLRGPPRSSPPLDWDGPEHFLKKRNFPPHGSPGDNLRRDRFSPMRQDERKMFNKRREEPMWDDRDKGLKDPFPEDDDCRSILIQKRMTKRDDRKSLSPRPQTSPVKKRINNAAKPLSGNKNSQLKNTNTSPMKKTVATKAKATTLKKQTTVKKPIFSRLGNGKEPLKARLKPLDPRGKF